MAAGRADRRPWIGAVLTAAAVLVSTACSAGSLGSSGGDGKVTLTFQIGNEPPAAVIGEALAEDFMAANPDVAIEIETRPGGTEGDTTATTTVSNLLQLQASVILYTSDQSAGPGSEPGPTDDAAGGA